MSQKRVVAVVGATGAQGGSVAKYLFEDGTYQVRALTRTVDSDKAKELRAKGAEVVQADLNEPETVVKALKGVYGVFGVTNFWEGANSDNLKEIRQGKNLVDAAKKTGINHFVWSTLEETTPPVEHFNSKAEINEYLVASGVPYTSLYTDFYYENFLYFPFFQIPDRVDESEKNSLVADFPLLWTDGPIPGYSVAETGVYVVEILKKPQEWLGKEFRILSEIITARQFIEYVRSYSGKEIRLVNHGKEEVESLNFEDFFTREIWQNMQFYYKHDGNLIRDPELTKRVNPNFLSFKDFVKENLTRLIPAGY